jgi:hypothetical protein
MKVRSSVVVLGIGFWMVSGRPALAQYDMGDALKKGAGEVVKQQAEQAGLISTPTAAAAASTPTAAATGAASTPGAASGSTAGAANAPAAAGTPQDADGD